MADGLARLPDFLVVGQEDWDEVERRNQLLVTALARRHPRTRFVFAELPRTRPRRLRRVGPPNVYALAPARPLPDRVPPLARVNDRLEAWQLRRALRRAALERPALWTQDPRAASLLPLLRVEPVVYDLTDDWVAFESDPRRRAGVLRRTRALAARADLVLACSRPLEQAAREWSDEVAYLPNAVEPPAQRNAPAAPPAELASLPRPLLGYVGTLHDARLDVELLARAAELRPGWSFVLLGPNLLRPASSERLLGLANVAYLGVRPHGDVPAYLEALDVCLVPHVVSDFTRSLDPLKLYEYLAAGRPVVATPTGNAPDLGEHVLVAADAEALVTQAERAIAADGPAQRRSRRAAVAGETWEARAESVERLLGAPAVAVAGERPDVSVVIVSRDTRALLERCLLAVREQQEVRTQTIVVDNASADGSPDLVRRRFPEVELVELAENAGFARANNLAFARCRGEYVLMLNSDAFLAPGALARLVAAAARRPSAAAFGPRLLNEDGSLQRSAWPFPNAGRLVLEAVLLHRPLRRAGLLQDLGTWPHDEERSVDFLVGACLLVRREALAEAGGLDERFWLYGEEADLCQRLARRGWEVVLVPAATAVHIGSASARDARERLLRFYRGQKTYLRKHGFRGAWPIARLALLVGSLLRGRWRHVAVAVDPRL